MADHPEVIRQQMEETRSHLAEKLEALEDQVTDTVQTTTEAVTETVENVKETVEKVSETAENVTDAVKETVESVGETFNLWTQADRHPWLVLGGSVLVGFLGAQLFGGSNRESNGEQAYQPPPSPSWGGTQPASTPAPAHAEQHREAAPQQKSWFWDELGRLKGLAVGAVMGLVRDMSKRVVPDAISNRVSEEIDRVTTQLGGEPVQGSVLPNNPTQS